VNWCRYGCTPPIDFLHNLPNKALTGGSILQNLENKGDNLQDIQNAGVMVSLELCGGHKPEAGGFCLYPTSDSIGRAQRWM
jgi:hypothetical protein